MNKENAKDFLPLVQALADGKVIQIDNGHGKWIDLEGGVHFGAEAAEYRIKPEPKDIWMNRYVAGDEIGPYSSCDVARSCASPGATQVRYREVVE